MKNIFFAALATLLLSISALNANTVVYGDYIGITMKFLDVQETSMSAGDTAPLYGAPTLSGDSLLFTHMTFSSNAQNGTTDITDGKLDGTIESKNNNDYYIDRIRFREFGDVTLAGTGTSATKASVANSLFVTVLDVDGAALLFPEIIAVNMVMTPGGNWNLATNGAFTGQIWSGNLEMDLTAVLAARGINGHATKVTFSMDNTLTTQSELNTSAFIAKKVNGLSVTPLLVPEPATMALLGLGALVLRRKKA